MAILKSTTFTALPVIGTNPTPNRRARVIAGLKELKSEHPLRAGQNVLTICRQNAFLKDTICIAVPSLDKLPAVIDTLISAVRGGELDEQLAQASKQVTVANSKRRAA